MNNEATLILEPITEAWIKAHARRQYPKESCGLVQVIKGKQQYVECTNIARGTEHFVMNPEDFVRADRVGNIQAIVHSHPGLPPIPSQGDRVSCEKSQLPWAIVCWPTGEIRIHNPDGYTAPLIGRHFSHGILDCYTATRDFYKQEAGVELPQDPERHDDWWLDDTDDDLYVDNFKRAGFIQVAGSKPDMKILQRHDVLLMRIEANKSNHSAVYIGGNIIFHHLIHRLSCREVYGGWYHTVTTHVLRHKDLQ